MSQAPVRFLLLVTVLVSTVATITACCDQKSQEQSKITDATVTPVVPPANVVPPVSQSYLTTLAEGIDFTKNGYPVFIAEVTGISGYEPWGRWTDGAKAIFRFVHPLPKQFTLVIQANVFGPNLGEVIKVNAGAVQQKFKITEQGQIHRLEFNLSTPVDTLELLIPQPTSPNDLKISEDSRKLGVGLIKLQIQPHDLTNAASSKS